MSATEVQSPAAEFVEFFAVGWSIGATDPERFFAHFEERFHDDVRMIQPIVPDTTGPRALRESFAATFAAMPDLVGEVLSWGETANGVLIELRLHGTFGGRPLEWVVVDRIVLVDGKVAQRTSYFDSLPLIGAMAKRPRAALPLLRSLVKRKDPR